MLLSQDAEADPPVGFGEKDPVSGLVVLNVLLLPSVLGLGFNVDFHVLLLLGPVPSISFSVVLANPFIRSLLSEISDTFVPRRYNSLAPFIKLNIAGVVQSKPYLGDDDDGVSEGVYVEE